MKTKIRSAKFFVHRRALTMRSIGILVLMSMTAPLAAQQEGKAPTGKETFDGEKQWREFFQGGRSAYLAGKLAESKRLFLKAGAIKMTPKILANLAQVEVQLKEYRAGATHAAAALAALGSNKGVEDDLAEAKKHVGAVIVAPNVEGANVTVDGAIEGTSPLPGAIFLEPGDHKVAVSKPGYSIVERDVGIEKGAEQRIEITLVPDTVPATPAVAASSPSNAVGSPPASSMPVFPFEEPTRKSVSGPDPFVLVLGGVVTLGGFASALAFNAKANAKYQKADGLMAKLDVSACSGDGSRTSDCSALRTSTENGNSARKWANVSAGVGGVALIGTLAYWLWPRGNTSVKTSTAPSAHMNVSMTPAGSWVGLAGDF